MTFAEILDALKRWWWLALLVPALAGPLLVYRAINAPYVSTVKATILIPGDTEIPGSSERPELMVLDDLPSLIASQVFAEAVAAESATQGSNIDAETAQTALLGSRYSRVLTVTASSENESEAEAIAAAAEAVLPGAVNDYLIADGSDPATVNIIDPASQATRAKPNQVPIFVAQMFVALAVGVGLALIADSVTRARQAIATSAVS